MFATGIENSYPVITGGRRVDEMEKCGHYRRWREDLELVRELGIHYLRWGPALYRTFVGPGRYDWSWTDEVLDEMGGRAGRPNLAVAHLGVLGWRGGYQTPDSPRSSAEYAGPFPARHSGV